MPKIPKWLGDTMEVVFSGLMHDVTVTATWFPAPRLKAVRFSGDLRKVNYKPGCVVEFRVSGTEFRHYTISHCHKEEGIFEIWFYLHGKGPGSAWAEALKPGDQLKAMGPTARLHFRERSTHHFVFGDETSVGVSRALTAAALQHGHEVASVIELEQAWDLPEDMVPADMQTPAKHALSKLDTWLQVYESSIPGSTFYLTGRAKSIQAMRKHLLAKGVSSGRILTEPYWAEGKRGL